MDLPIDSDIAFFSVAMAEAIEELVNEHDAELDKRAAMLSLAPPALSQNGSSLDFVFSIRSGQSIVASPSLSLMPEMSQFPSRRRGGQDLSLLAIPHCDCDHFTAHEQCAHTLAASWWLQEQLGRRSMDDLGNFFAELKVDAVSLGQTLVDELLRIADRSQTAKPTDSGCRVQWRIRLSATAHYGSLAITPYEQRVRKGSGGWTKGRELRLFDLENRPELFTDPVDSRVASLVARAGSSYGPQISNLFEALLMLAGHPNVAWNDTEATPVEVHRGELTLSLVRADAADGDGDGEGDDDYPAEQAANSLAGTSGSSQRRFRPKLRIPGIDLDISSRSCQIISGKTSPTQPLLVIVPNGQDRCIVCELKDSRTTRLIEHLLAQNLDEVLLDPIAAGRLSTAVGKLDSMIRVDLPGELSGPIEPGKWEMVVQLRPRPAAGLHVAIGLTEPRLSETLVPAEGPDLIRCATEEGPVRLSRDLEAELQETQRIAQRFGLNDLIPEGPHRWVATTDDAALNLLGALYESGDEAPAIVWPEGQTMKVRGEITPQALKIKLDDRRDWFGLSGSIEIEGKEMPLADLLAAVRENRNLVRVGDREFAQISDLFRRRLQQLGDAIVAERGGLRIADAAAPLVRELLSDDVLVEADARWQTTLRRLDDLQQWVPEVPAGLQVNLRDYQAEGYRWLARLSRWGVGGVLADDMGLGKTVQTLAVLLDRAAGGPALIVAPTSVGDNWIRETARFAPELSAHSYREHDRQHLIDSAKAGDLVVVSYQLLQRDAERFASRSWHTLVLDEAQFIKNAATKTSQAIRAIQADWRLGLSGTPLENHLGELWSLFRTLSPGLLGSWERFRTRFAEPIQRHKDDERRQSLAHLVRPFILRRTKATVLTELPERTEVTLYAEMSSEERKRYEDARLAAITELSGERNAEQAPGDQRMRTLAWLTKLRQLACHPRLVDRSWRKGSAKLELFLETVQELREGEHRALVFSQFVKHLELLRAALDERGITYQYLDGSTPASERQRRVDAFQNGEGELFLISLKAGGTGLNLTAANYVLHLDPWWNPAVEDQATDRAHRIGQERAVTVYRLVSKGTIEEQIIDLHANKRELVASVLSGTDQAGRMDTEELIELIRAGT